MNVKRYLRYAALLVPFMSGCSSVDRQASFADVQKILKDRGTEGTHWRGDPVADAAVDAKVQELLSGTLTADKAVTVALLNNRTLQATYEELGVAEADLVAAGLLANPAFDAEIRFFEGAGTPGAEVGLVQNFLNVFFIPLKKRVAAAALERSKYRVAAETLGTASEVRAAFFGVQAAQQTLEMRQQVVKAAEGSFRLARQLRAAGNISDLELAQEQALFEQSKVDLRKAEVAAIRTRERLNVLMGAWGDQTRWEIADRLPDVPADQVDPEDLEKRAVEKSLELAATRRAIEEDSALLGVARPLALFSEGALGLSGEHEADGEWGFGPAFSVPLPLFNQGSPAAMSRSASLRRANEQYIATAVTLRAEVRAVYAELTAARDQVSYYKQVILPLREKILYETQLQYNAMQIGAFQLLKAKEDQIEAGSAYIDALLRYWLAQTEMDQLLSGKMVSFDARPAADSALPDETRHEEVP